MIQLEEAQSNSVTNLLHGAFVLVSVTGRHGRSKVEEDTADIGVDMAKCCLILMAALQDTMEVHSA